MSSVTLRDLPPELHKELKESAQRNRRSLNAEILWRLENTGRAIQKVSVEETKDRIRRVHEKLDFTTTDDEIRNAIRQGRR
jgi:plasmid stability protein